MVMAGVACGSSDYPTISTARIAGAAAADAAGLGHVMERARDTASRLWSVVVAVQLLLHSLRAEVAVVSGLREPTLRRGAAERVAQGEWILESAEVPVVQIAAGGGAAAIAIAAAGVSAGRAASAGGQVVGGGHPRLQGPHGSTGAAMA